MVTYHVLVTYKYPNSSLLVPHLNIIKNITNLFKRRPPPPPTRATPPKRKRRPKKPAKPTKPAPTDFVGEKPRWVEVMQKGPNCVADTTAAVPCKDPLKRELKSVFLAELDKRPCKGHR